MDSSVVYGGPSGISSDDSNGFVNSDDLSKGSEEDDLSKGSEESYTDTPSSDSDDLSEGSYDSYMETSSGDSDNDLSKGSDESYSDTSSGDSDNDLSKGSDESYSDTSCGNSDDLSEESDESQDEKVEEPYGRHSSTRSEWLPVSSKRRIHSFTGKEEMNVNVNNVDDETEALPFDVYGLCITGN